MQQQNNAVEIPQYSLGKTLLIWVAAALPMGILGWVIAPALSVGSTRPGFVRLAVLTIGLVWQFVLVVILLRREAGSLSWSSVKQRLWLLKPSTDQGRHPDGRLWWWLVPIIILTALYEMKAGAVLDHLWVSLVPALAEPPRFSMAALLDGRASGIARRQS